jgi:hypothetical protein
MDERHADGKGRSQRAEAGEVGLDDLDRGLAQGTAG